MKVIVTGAKGQLGKDVIECLSKSKHTAIGVDIEDVDIRNEADVYSLILENSPDAVIHCAAWTAVDSAEDHKDEVMDINWNGTLNIAKACKKIDCKMMYISTDYVFNGEGDQPWEPDCEEYTPLNTYGESKLKGELEVRKLLEKCFIVRIAWVFGASGNNFVTTMLKIGKSKDEISVVCDQIGTPTYTKDLARLLVEMVETNKYGIYHATNEGGYISWFDFAKKIFEYAFEMGDDRYSPEKLKVLPILTKDYASTKAKRPLNSRLSKDKLIDNGFELLPTWEDALRRYLNEIEF